MTMNRTQNNIDTLKRLITSSMTDAQIAEALDNYHENDIAAVLEFLDSTTRRKLYHLLGLERTAEVLTYVDDIRPYLGELDAELAADILENMDADDAVDALEDLDEEARKKLMALMDADAREDVILIRSYDDDEIGSLMTTNYVVIDTGLTIKQATKSVIAQAEENDNINTIYVTHPDGTFDGAIDLKDLIVARDILPLEDIISHSYPFVRDHETIADCIEQLKDYGEDSIPVLNDSNHIIGVITSQDIIEAVDDEMGDDYAKLAGLTAEEDMQETLFQSMKKRLPWLIALLFLGMGVSTIVGMFEHVVAEVALIVCFQSLILDMAGNVGTQSLAVTIRVLMDENLDLKTELKLVLKEMRVGFANGTLLGLFSFICIGLYVWLLKGKTIYYAFAISGCVGIALLVSMIIASCVGTIIPIFFHKIHVDPAVASGPLITTVDDLVAIVTYYGLAWILLIQVLQF